MSGVDWGPGVVVLALGLLLGGLALWLLARPGSALTPQRALANVPDLEARRDGLFQQLRELEDTSDKRTPEQLARERYALELDAASVLLALDRGGGAGRGEAEDRATHRKAAPENEGRARRPALRGFLWGVSSASVMALLLFLVVRGSRDREGGASPTGGPPGGEASSREGAGTSGAEADPEVARLRATLETNPGDVETRLNLARLLLSKQDLMGVWNETQQVLEHSPGHPRALAYQALVRLAMGQGELAVDMLKQAKAKAPDLLEAYLHLSLVYVRMGRTQEAEATMAEASRRFPDQAPTLAKLMAEMKQQVAEAPPSLPGDPHARVPATSATGGAAATAGGSDSGSAAATAPSTAGVAGVLDLDPTLQGTIAPGTVVFVTLRAAGVKTGPPVAVERLAVRSFPLAFAIGAANSMMGGELPKRVRIEARADSDGDPMTRSPSDPLAEIDDVGLGASNLRLLLKR